MNKTTSAGFDGWYYLGNISAESSGGSSDLLPADVVVVAKNNSEGQAQAKKLHNGGIWFIIK